LLDGAVLGSAKKVAAGSLQLVLSRYIVGYWLSHGLSFIQNVWDNQILTFVSCSRYISAMVDSFAVVTSRAQ
jgi:hypothetical protein